MRLTTKERCNVLVGVLLDMPSVLTDLPSGYAGEDYMKSDRVLMAALEDAVRRKSVRERGET